MKLPIIVFLVTLSFVSAVNGKLEPPNDRELDVAKFITSVVHNCTESDLTKNHDVVLIEMQMGEKSDAAGKIIENIMREVPSSSILIHRSLKSIEKYRAHSASFYIIVTDNDDLVRNFRLQS